MEYKVPVTEIETPSEDGLQDVPLNEIHTMAYDDVLHHIGGFGRYQKRIYFLLCLTVIPCAFHKLAGVFLGGKPKHRCVLPFEYENATYKLDDDIVNVSLPWNNFAQERESCEYYDANYTKEYFREGIPANKTKHCDKWIFYHPEFKSSTVIEFLLVCDRAWLRATADALFMTGVLIGSYVFGDLSDRFGRRPTFFISLVIQLIGGLLAAIAPEYITFVLARILIGASTSGVFLVAYVIAMEMVGSKERTFAGTFVHMFFSIGFLFIAGLAYLLQDSWRLFQVAITLVPGAFFMSYWWVIPESSRWLMTKGKHAEAKEILMKAAKENNKTDLTEDLLDNLLTKGTEDENVSEEKKRMLDPENSNYEIRQRNGDVPYKETTREKPRQPTILDLMKYPSLRKRSINIFFNWFVCSLAYYGLSWGTGLLEGNTYLNFCLSGIMEFPGYSIPLFTLNRFGRKVVLCGALIVSGIALILTIFVPADTEWLTITLAMIGKLAITSAYGTVYVFSVEQFPTVIRNAGLGAASMSARIGGILAPYILLLSEFWNPLPLLIFGGLALCAGGLALLLPETVNRKLPETIEEGENFCKQPLVKAARQRELKLSKIEENGA